MDCVEFPDSDWRLLQIDDEEEDRLFAKKLQEEYDREACNELEENLTGHETNNPMSNNTLYTSLEISPVDPSLETSDPNPDIRELFLQFNCTYFWSKLSGIEVKWSPRMTLCAGLCVYEGHGGLCSVRLSLPLLKLRPRKDLVETLLHEMIHAYLFVTDNDRDHDGHGPQFKKHMKRINDATGADISIYHTFHDEVAAYQQHWWKCNGPCQKRAPYYGLVKRAMNRAPSARDFWWPEHQRTCGGTYSKIKEPDGYGQKKKKTVKADDKKSKVGPNQSLFSFVGKDKAVTVLSSTSGNIDVSSENLEEKKENNVKNVLNKSNSWISSEPFQRKISDTSIHSKSKTTQKDNSKDVKISDMFKSFEISKKAKKDGSKNQSSSFIEEDNDCFIDNNFSFKTSFVSNRTRKDGFRDNKKNIPKKKSVCDGAHFSKSASKKAKYIFDELDNDDGLWNSIGLSRAHSETKNSDQLTIREILQKARKDRENREKEKELSQRDKNRIDDKINHLKHEVIMNTQSKPFETKYKDRHAHSVVEEKNSTINNRNVTESCITSFSGTGYKLGGAGRQTFDQKRSKEGTVSYLNTNKKRSLEDAFGADANVSETKRSNTAEQVIDTPSSSTSSSDGVTCPVCSINIAMGDINIHLDQCLTT